MTARGKEDQISKAKDIITSTVIGLVITLAAYAITYFVMQAVAPSTSGNNYSTEGNYPDPDNYTKGKNFEGTQ